MTPYETLNRRLFLRSIGSAPLIGSLSVFGQPVATRQRRTAQPVFAYVGSPDSLHVFSVDSTGWALRQSISSRFPCFLAIHPNGRFLFALNGIDEHDGLPRGTAESYQIDLRTGRLDFLNRRPLSLSATRPGHFAIAPDGGSLIVATYGGGLYNALPIETSGALGPPTAILKEVGSGADGRQQQTAHPHSVIFDATGAQAIATDLGSDRLTIFSLAQGKLARRGQVSLRSGMGPGHLAMHASGKWFYVFHELDGSLGGYRYRAESSAITQSAFQTVATRPAGSERQRGWLASHPGGDYLYSAILSEGSSSDGTITTWKVDRGSGRLSLLMTYKERGFAPSLLELAPDGGSLFALDGKRGRLLQFGVDSGEQHLHHEMEMATAPAPISLALAFR